MNTTKNKSSRHWSSLFINAIISFAIAAVLIFVPKSLYHSLIIGFGAIMLISGIGFILYTIKHKQTEQKTKLTWYFQAIVNVVIGSILILKPGLLFDIIHYLVSAWLILSGIIQLIISIRKDTTIKKKKLFLGNNIFTIALGLLIFLWPTFPLVIIGYLCLIIGLLLLYFSLLLYRNK